MAATVIARGRSGGREYAVADCGLKALGMDHGLPDLELGDGSRASVWFCSDEHVTFSLPKGSESTLPELGSLVAVRPAHVDPTVALHERFVVVRDGVAVDEWAVDLRGW